MARGGDARAVAPPAGAWSLNLDTVDGWLEKARAGDELVYARGVRPGNGDGVKALQQAFDEGRITFTSRRNGPSDISFIAQRLAEARRPAPALRLHDRVVTEDDDEIAMLMAVLRRRAARGQQMGTNRELAEDIGAKGPDRVAYLLRKQISAGRIRVEAAGIGLRVCTIVATGKRTASE